MTKTPTNLDEAVDYLLARMTEADKKEFADGAWLFHCRNQLSSLAHVFFRPKWLQVSVMKALPLLLGICQIKRRARDDVIDMPASQRVILPSHSGLELSLKMCSKLLSCASKQFHSAFGWFYQPSFHVIPKTEIQSLFGCTSFFASSMNPLLICLVMLIVSSAYCLSIFSIVDLTAFSICFGVFVARFTIRGIRTCFTSGSESIRSPDMWMEIVYG